MYASLLDQATGQFGRYRCYDDGPGDLWTVSDCVMKDCYSEPVYGFILWYADVDTAHAVRDQINEPPTCALCGEAPSVAELATEPAAETWMPRTITDWRIGPCTTCKAARALTPLVAA